MNMIDEVTCRLASLTWDQLPEDVLEIIFANLWTGDRVRLRLVCKLWNRILVQPTIPIAPEAPWKILSDDSYNNPESYLTQVCLESFSENRIYRFKLPVLAENTNGGWLCGYSRGWLVLAVGPNLNPNLFLWNPLSGATRKLPPLSTLPFFEDLKIFDHELNAKIQNFSSVIGRMEIFSIGSGECVVAVLFSRNRIIMCTSLEERWTPFIIEGETELSIKLIDILFHSSGKLIVLASSNPFSTNTERDIFLSKKFQVSLKNCQVQVIPYFTPYDANPLEPEFPSGFSIGTRSAINWKLLESSLTHNLLCIALKLESFGGYGDGKGIIPKFACLKTIQMSLEPNDREISKREAIFVGKTGSFMLPVVQGILPDHVYFAMDCAVGCVGNMNFFTGREYGQYNLPEQKMHQYDFINIKFPPESKVGWFMPRLFML